MPVEVTVAGEQIVLQPTETWQTLPVEIAGQEDFVVDPDYFVVPRDVNSASP